MRYKSEICLNLFFVLHVYITRIVVCTHFNTMIAQQSVCYKRFGFHLFVLFINDNAANSRSIRITTKQVCYAHFTHTDFQCKPKNQQQNSFEGKSQYGESIMHVIHCSTETFLLLLKE